jgi:hypothetical protein
VARLFALTFVVALHVGVALLLTGRWQPFAGIDLAPAPAATPREEASSEPVTVRTVVDWTHAPEAPTATARETVAADTRVVVDLDQARAAGRAHAQRHVESIQRMRRRQYGDAIAALVEAPVREGWPALEQLAREGDRAAAEALLEKTARCEPAPTRDAAYAKLADEASRGLDPVSAAFIRAALEHELAYLRRESDECRATGFGTPRLEMLLRERRIEPEGSALAVSRQFLEEYRAEAAPVYPGPFGAVLERLGSDDLTTDEWITLIAASDTDRAVAYALGYLCLERSCAGMPKLPPSERPRLLRAAADAGNVRAARALAEDFANAGDLGSAYGWMLFARWADASGCNPVATTLDLADTLRGIASLEAVLSPGQRRAGEMLGAALVTANAAGARSVWSCPG